MIAYAPAVAGFQERVEVGDGRVLAASDSDVSPTNRRCLETLEVLKTLPKDSLIFWVRYSPVTKIA